MESIDWVEMLLTAGITVVQWLVYTGLLWGMIKIQKLNYHPAGLFASSLLATLVAMIPYAGGYLAYAVLLLCLWKCTGAEIVPDVVFTVCIAGALMFCFNLFAIGAMMGKLRPDLGADGHAGMAFGMEDSFNEGMETPDAGDESDDTDNVRPVRNGRQSKPLRKTPEVFATSAAGPHSLALKGVTVNAGRASALVFDGRRTQTIFEHEPFAVDFRSSRARLVCEKISRNGVLLVTDRGERVLLRLKPAPGEGVVE